MIDLERSLADYATYLDELSLTQREVIDAVPPDRPRRPRRRALLAAAAIAVLAISAAVVAIAITGGDENPENDPVVIDQPVDEDAAPAPMPTDLDVEWTLLEGDENGWLLVEPDGEGGYVLSGFADGLRFSRDGKTWTDVASDPLLADFELFDGLGRTAMALATTDASTREWEMLVRVDGSWQRAVATNDATRANLETMGRPHDSGYLEEVEGYGDSSGTTLLVRDEPSRPGYLVSSFLVIDPDGNVTNSEIPLGRALRDVVGVNSGGFLALTTGGDTASEVWESDDGLTWALSELGPDEWPARSTPTVTAPTGVENVAIDETDYGYAATAFQQPVSVVGRAWLSADGAEWEEIEVPAMDSSGLGFVGGAAQGAVGSVLYFSLSAEERSRIWIGVMTPTGVDVAWTLVDGDGIGFPIVSSDGDDGYVLSGFADGLRFSADGSTWTNVAPDPLLEEYTVFRGLGGRTAAVTTPSDVMMDTWVWDLIVHVDGSWQRAVPVDEEARSLVEQALPAAGSAPGSATTDGAGRTLLIVGPPFNRDVLVVDSDGNVNSASIPVVDTVLDRVVVGAPWGGFLAVVTSGGTDREVEVWTSDDGLEWKREDPVPELQARAGSEWGLALSSDSGLVRVDVVDSDGTPAESYTTDDGVTWIETDSPPPPPVTFVAPTDAISTTIDTVDVGHAAISQFTPTPPAIGTYGRAWIAADGGSWDEVDVPVLDQTGLGFVGVGTSGATGSVLYIGLGGDRNRIWIGVITPAGG